MARVVRPGASGEPEINDLPLPISLFIRKQIVSQLLEFRADFFRDDPLASDAVY
ncbi:MAG: hypothetical protein JXA30_09060 [Deltaproteobacteria bacterium]|nr:hypothetical protein [Deltaproteobacteria bacterium]